MSSSAHFLSLLVVVLFTCGQVHAVMCGSDEMKVQKKGVDIESNGCSKPAFIEVPGEEDFTYCCDRHDACYATCNLSKSYCDTDFGNCMKKMCKSHFSTNTQCGAAAETYTMGTRVFGEEGYQDLQQRHCTCVDKNKMRDHYEDTIESYLSKYIDESKRNSTLSYMEKSKYTESKPQKLFYQIVKKFPQIIQHIESRVSRRDIPGYDEL